MVYKNYLIILLKIIAALTIVSGLVQLLYPGFVLKVIGGMIDPTTKHFFGIVGLFMALFGGLLYQALRESHPNSVAVFWCGLQKFGAVAAVVLGVSRGIFSGLALGVATFDLVSGILIAIYWFSIMGRTSNNL